MFVAAPYFLRKNGFSSIIPDTHCPAIDSRTIDLHYCPAKKLSAPVQSERSHAKASMALLFAMVR
jgi:hypothetical protein